MKLFLYDSKHEQVLDSIEIVNTDDIQRVIDFLNKNKLTNRYKELIIADSYKKRWDEEDGYEEIIFEENNYGRKPEIKK